MNFIDSVMAFKPYDEITSNLKQEFIDIYNKYGDEIFDRENKLFHVTSSSIILNKECTKMLMIYHNLYQNYGWQGGHNDSDPDCLRVAIKEAKEETSLLDFQVNDKVYSLDILPVFEHYKKGKYVNSHLHLNLTYVFIADESSPIKIKEDENSDIRWVNISDLDNLVNEPEMLKLYKRVIEKYKEDLCHF